MTHWLLFGLHKSQYTVFTEIFIVLISDVTFITKFKKLEMHSSACWAFPKLKPHENLKNELLINENFRKYGNTFSWIQCSAQNKNSLCIND